MVYKENQPGLSLDEHVVQICELGCTHVYRVIELIESGQSAKELADIPEQQLPHLLIELRSIMAVYEARDD